MGILPDAGRCAMEPDSCGAIIRLCRVGESVSGRFEAMKISAALLAVAALTLAANSAEAKGCIKGAVVGNITPVV